jgi:hypothetical protein
MQPLYAHMGLFEHCRSLTQPVTGIWGSLFACGRGTAAAGLALKLINHDGEPQVNFIHRQLCPRFPPAHRARYEASKLRVSTS